TIYKFMGYFLEKFYPYLPPALQNVGISLFGYYWHKRRFGGVFKKELPAFKERENYSRAQWHAYQTSELRKLLTHAFEHVPFYKASFSAAGFSASDLAKIELGDLPKLPMLEKEDLRRHGTGSLLADNRKPGSFFASSGSTGTPTSIYFSNEMHQRWSAGFEARIRHWAGVNNKMSRGMIGGRRVLPKGHDKPPYYRYNFVEKQVYFSAYHISPQTAAQYLQGIKKYKLDYMTGYAASNYFLARFIDELKLDAPPLKAVITSSEKLTPDMRQVFERVYHCKSYDSYSGVEACGLISECEHGGLHLSEDIGIIEFLDELGNPAQPGAPAEMVCTGLLNFDQPLIRYRIGDMAVWTPEKCSCGRNMPLVKEILGRMEDVVVGKDGREMVRFHGIFINLPHVLEAQLVQENYDQFVINISSGGKITPEEKETITSRMFSQLGPVKIQFNEVNPIPRGPNGKFKAVISKVTRKKLTSNPM
ncbi:MAG: phenylacetate--CoA ligase family protein, partial [Bacteroidota bacterium]